MQIQRTAAFAGLAIVASATTAAAQVVSFDFPINVDQTVPAANVGSATPSGSGAVTLNTDTNLLEWVIDYNGLTGDIVSPGAHFHGPADFGATAGVVVDLAGNAAGTGTGAPLPQPPSGQLTGSFTVSDAQEAAILDGLWYVNIHTAANGPGEIRGQVVPTPAPAALLPLAGLAATRRRR